MRLTVIALLTSAFLAGPASADAAMECSQTATSQVEVGDCVGQVEESVNAVLEEALGVARSAAEELDAITERRVAVPALEASQAAWLAWRDAECEFAGAMFGGGSGTGIAITACRIEATRDRIEVLFAVYP